MFKKMKQKIQKKLDFNLNKHEEKMLEDRIQIANINKLKYISVVVVGLFSILFISTFFGTKSVNLTLVRTVSRYIYFDVAFIALIAYILSKKYLPKQPHFTIIVWYSMLLSLYGFAIWVGVFGQIPYPAVTFFVFLLALPLFVIDKPIRIILSLIMISIVFLTCSYIVKDFEIFMLDLGNCFTFFTMSVATSLQMDYVNIEKIINEIKLEEQRDIDNLSSLFNKASFERKIENYLHDEGILLIIDIDNFKIFNDTYGHIFGDAIIRAFGKHFSEIFSTNALTSRFGGDEFIVYISGHTDIKDIEQKFTLLTNKMNEKIVEPKLTLSCGGAIYPEDGNDYLTLLKNADIKLYEIKNSGKGSIKIK